MPKTKCQEMPPLEEGYHITVSICEVQLSRAELDDIKAYFIESTRNLIRKKDLRTKEGHFIKSRVRISAQVPVKPQ